MSAYTPITKETMTPGDEGDDPLLEKTEDQAVKKWLVIYIILTMQFMIILILVVDPGFSVYAVSVYHQYRCLNWIRKGLSQPRG